jgi:hypothetical protein
VLVLALLAAASSATSQRARPAPYVFGVSLLDPGPVREVLGEEVIGAPRPGRYFVLDFQGLLAEVRVFRSRELTSSMVSGGSPPHQYELRLVGRPARGAWSYDPPNDTGHIVAVGPLREVPTRGRLMRMGLALAGLAADAPQDAPGVPLPPGIAPDELTYAIDLDGDAAADLFSYGGDRDLPTTERYMIRTGHHREMWSRASGAWSRTATLDWETTAPID